ncbi:MAG: hypothetical protein KJ607_09180, partial [Bacteroidetes bacterium]|nr:hypothetical protein [Bacteroidota bacterium]
YQAYTETGMYGYRIDRYKDLLKVYTEDVDNAGTFIPDSIEAVYDPAPLHDVVSWLDEYGDNFIYIYGEGDAWSATAYTPTSKTNSVKLVQKGGAHGVRIGSLSEKQKSIVFKKLSEWMEMEVPVRD